MIYIYISYIYIQFLRLSQAILLLIMCKYSYIYNHICIYSEMYLIYIYNYNRYYIIWIHIPGSSNFWGLQQPRQVWVAAETGRVCYTEADVAKMKAGRKRRC